MNTNHVYHLVFCILTFIFMFSPVVSDICSDRSKVNFTIRCNFEDCHIPGEYCDRSDSDFYRCAKCDEDVCNGGIVPGECKIPCLEYSSDEMKDIRPATIVNNCTNEDTAWDAERGRGFFILMTVSMALNVGFAVSFLILVMKFINQGKYGLGEGEESKQMEQVTDKSNENQKMAPSSSTSEITVQKSCDTTLKT